MWSVLYPPECWVAWRPQKLEFVVAVDAHDSKTFDYLAINTNGVFLLGVLLF